MATLAARASAGLGAMKNPVNILTINMTLSIGFVLFNSTLSSKDTNMFVSTHFNYSFMIPWLAFCDVWPIMSKLLGLHLTRKDD